MTLITNKFRFLTSTLNVGDNEVAIYGLLNGRRNNLPDNLIKPFTTQIDYFVFQSQVGYLSYRDIRIDCRAYMMFSIVDDAGVIFNTQPEHFNRGILPAFFLQNSYRYYTCEYIYIPTYARL